MVTDGILIAVLLAALAGLALSARQAKVTAAGIRDLIGCLQLCEAELEDLKTAVQAIPAARPVPEAEAPDAEAAKRARAEIDRFNSGIANILSFGAEKKDGGRP